MRNKPQVMIKHPLDARRTIACRFIMDAEKRLQVERENLCQEVLRLFRGKPGMEPVPIRHGQHPQFAQAFQGNQAAIALGKGRGHKTGLERVRNFPIRP